MGRRSLIARTLVAASVAAAPLAILVSPLAAQRPNRPISRAQAVLWNAAAAADTADETPIVSVRLEGSNYYAYGAPVRVWFNVNQDAFVIVARVDANGHLTLLYPSSRTATTEVKAGTDIPIRGRRGSSSFYATDRLGGGYVFAIASFYPFDLSSLGLRDFDRYVTGTYVGRPTSVYIGDPHRVITRFASIVTFGRLTPIDYDVAYYSVDAPYYVSSVGYSNYCSGRVGMYRPGLMERWDDEMFYGGGFGSVGGCDYYLSCYGAMGAAFGFGYTTGFYNSSYIPGCYARPSTPTSPIPPQGPVTDSVKVPGWLPDSIQHGTPDTVGTIPERRNAEAFYDIKRQTTYTPGIDRSGSADPNDPSRRSYSIPEGALRRTPTTFAEGRDRGGLTTAGRPDRISPTATGGGTGIEWVRPPREVTDVNRGDYSSGVLPRSPRSGGSRGARDYGSGRPTYVNSFDGRAPVRGDTRYEPPSRSFGPRFDAPPPSVRNSAGQPSYAPIPSRFDNGSSRGGSAGAGSGRVSAPPPSAGSSGGASGGQSAAPSRPAESRPSGGEARPASTEKKPDTP